MIWAFFLIDFIYSNGRDMRIIQPPNLQQVIEFKEILLYFITIKSILYFISFVLTIIERTRILNEIKRSIYKDIDNNINEEIFNNIIEQCKYPRNKELAKQYADLLDKSRKGDETMSQSQISELDQNNLNKPLIN